MWPSPKARSNNPYDTTGRTSDKSTCRREIFSKNFFLEWKTVERARPHIKYHRQARFHQIRDMTTWRTSIEPAENCQQFMSRTFVARRVVNSSIHKQEISSLCEIWATQKPSGNRIQRMSEQCTTTARRRTPVYTHQQGSQ